MKTILAFAAAFALVSPAIPGSPRSGAWLVGNDSYHLYYEDLDMTTVTGRAKLLERVEKVAAKLCGDTTEVEQKACVDQLVANLHNRDVARALADRNGPALAKR
jgi:UrcA family protein